MLDMVPSISPVQTIQAAPTAATPVSTPSGTSPADPVSGSSASASNDATPGSFADTLRARLKQVALGKGKAAAPANPAANDKTGAANAIPANGVDPLDKISAAIKEAALVAKEDKASSKSDKAEDKSEDSTPAAAQPAADPAQTPPIIVPVTAPVTTAAARVPASPQPCAKTTTEVATSPDKVQTQTANQESQQPATTAILAAEPEKTDLPAATRDNKSDGTAFQDALNSKLVNANTVVNTAVPATNATQTRVVQTPFASANWANDVGNQVSWMTSHGQSRAELVLNPPELGRIAVSITMNGDQASASFASANPEVRDVLQGSLPRLREVLADAGVFLGQANVGAESFGQNQNGTEKGGKSPDDSISSTTQSLLGSINRPLQAPSAQGSQGRGLIDLFA